MTIPINITRDHILHAIEKISIDGIPDNRKSTQFNIFFENRLYPPKYTISIANYYANGTELPVAEFSSGEESNKFLKDLGFTIVDNLSELKKKNNGMYHTNKKVIKQVSSWSKLEKPNLIARKKVDWSVFNEGTVIPHEFHEYFEKANNGHHLERGEKHKTFIELDNTTYETTLVNVDRKTVSSDTLQLLFNKDLKDLCKKAFSASYKYIQKQRELNANRSIVVPNEVAEYIDFYQTGEPFVYRAELITKSSDTYIIPSFWWVNQGKTHTQEKEGEFLWAPQKSKRGFPVPHHVSLLKAKLGDIVFCYSEKELKSVGIVEYAAIEAPKPNEIKSDAWQKAGYLLKLNYFDFTPYIKKDEIPERLRMEEAGPFDRNGDLKQGYFFELTDRFSRELFQLFQDRFPREVRLKMEKQSTEEEIVRESDSDYLTYKGLVDHIDHYIKSKGFYYTKEEIINLFLSLKTKPFVILSGISGTGKTKIVQWFAESVGANEENGQFTLIPIRPDWNDGSDLLGYVDIKGDFKEGPLTKVVKRAEQNPKLPYFVLLDEMNLARVEHYFSDILSVMESRKWENGQIVSSNLLTEEMAGVNLKLPINLYIIGTVNMDETTHPFSKKVLDRANTIEFNRVALDNLAFLEELKSVDPIAISHEKLSSNYLHLKDVYGQHKELVETATDELVKMNEALQLINAHVGYRVRDEICFYLANNEEGGLLDYKAAMDHCILQKVLPRIAGSDSRVDELLGALYRIFTNKEALDDIENNQADLDTAKYPRSAEKVLEMLRRLRDDGFTSFWVS